jgi:hypothetical protein
VTVIRFPLRAVAAVLVCKEKGGDGWITIAGVHGWLFGSIAEARAEARWLSHNLGGLPIRELEHSA